MERNNTMEKQAIPQKSISSPKLKKNVKYCDITQDIQNSIDKITGGQQYHIYKYTEFQNYTLDCSSDDDCWILLKSKEIVKVMFILSISSLLLIIGQKLKQIQNVFTIPFESSSLFIYSCGDCSKVGKIELFTMREIKCKMFKLKEIFIDDEDEDSNKNSHIFIPILHTLQR